jgi:hypothetical protein
MIWTTEEVYGNWNAPPAVTAAAVIYVIRCLVNQEIPLNQGQGLTLAHFSAQLIVFNGIGGARRGWVAHVKGVLGGV